MTRRSPSNTRQLLEAAVASHRAGKLDEAAAHYQDVLKRDPKQPDALGLLGQIAYQQGDPAKALDLMQRAHALKPESAAVSYNLGRLYLDLRQWDKAAAATQAALRSAPTMSAAHCNLGVALIRMGRAEEGEAAVRKALDGDANNALSWSALGLALARQDKRDEARAAFEKAVALDPNLAEARFNLGEVLLGDMDFARGWPLFEARREGDPASFATGGVMPDMPLWQGEDITTKTILVWGEQGLGDQILFASMIADLCIRARHVMIACDPRLAALFTRSFPRVTVLAQDQNIYGALKAQAADVLIPIASLGRFLRPTREAFAVQRAFLVPDRARVDALRARYAALAQGRPLVGFSWRSSRADIGAAKSIPFSIWRKIISSTQACFVSLQYGDVEEDVGAATAAGLSLHHDADIDARVDLDGQAAQISALDLVVSVSNTTVHLAGALGAPVWTLAPLGAGRMWYWFAPVNPWAPSPWYPPMRIYHQQAPGRWETLAELVSHQLAGHFKHGTT